MPSLQLKIKLTVVLCRMYIAIYYIKAHENTQIKELGILPAAMHGN